MPRKNQHDKIRTGEPTGIPKSEAQWEEFLVQVVENAGNITRACEVAKISRESVYMKRKNPEFEARFQEAKRKAVETLEDEATRRAYAGTQENVFYLGKKIDTKTTYSDGLIQFLLRAHAPEKYKERISTENTNLNVDVTPAEETALMDSLAAKLGAVLDEPAVKLVKAKK